MNEILLKFNPDVPLVVHWDGKILPELTGKTSVDRLPILTTGAGITQLLGVSKLSSGTAEATAAAVYNLLEHWNVTNKVKAMCFDITASNSGQKNGACVLLEGKNKQNLLHLACRHYIYELVLGSGFSVTIKYAASPDIQLFKRFQTKWPEMDHVKYRTALDDVHTKECMSEFREECIATALEHLANQQPRDDYRELLEISIIFLASIPPRGVHILAPGAFHKARWMAKAIYAIKIWMFAEQFSLTKAEKSGIAELALFVAVLYVKAWFQIPLPVSSPLNDLQFLMFLNRYENINKNIATVTLQKFCAHLRYLGEELCALALFDRRVSVDEKSKIVLAMQGKIVNENPPKRATINVKTDVSSLHLQQFVTNNTKLFFKKLDLPTDFFNISPERWDTNESYLIAARVANSLQVVNDTAERAVALMEAYNSLHMRDEEQYQYLLQVVRQHRTQFPNFKKSSLIDIFSI